MSKRNYKRLVKKQSILYKNRYKENEVNSESDFLEPIQYIAEPVEDGGQSLKDLATPKHNLCDKLKQWYIETAPSRKCLEKLLAILQEEGLDVPLSAAALLGKKHEVAIKKVFPGSYCHIGIGTQFGDILKIYDKIELDINIDGIPLFKSSRIQLWPILLKIVNVKEKVKPFPVGIYVGHTKPSCVKEFFKDFVEEVLSLKDGFIFNDKKINIEFRCLSCDTPAKAFVCGVPGHTASHGCTKCTQVSKKIGHVLTYSTSSGTLISDTDFSLRKYEKHHIQKFKVEKTPLEEIGFNMVTQIPLDSMHLIDLHQIFGHDIIMNFNIDGTFGKKRLRDYVNVFAAMIDAISTFSESSDKPLRAAFQRQKKKYFKQTSRSKGKNKEQHEGDTSEQEQ